MNGCLQIASHLNLYALHAQEHMKNHFTMLSRVYILTYSEFMLDLPTVKLRGLVVFIGCLRFRSLHGLALTE